MPILPLVEGVLKEIHPHALTPTSLVLHPLRPVPAQGPGSRHLWGVEALGGERYVLWGVV